MALQMAYRRSGVSGAVDPQDLEQIAMMELWGCIERFDGKYALSTYINARLPGMIAKRVNDLRDVPRWVVEAGGGYHKVNQAVERLRACDGVTPSVDQISEITGIGHDAVRGILSTSWAPVFYEGERTDGGQASPEERFGHESSAFGGDDPGMMGDPAEHYLNEVSQGQIIDRALARLNDRQRMVVQRYIVDEVPIADVAAELRISPHNVHQIKTMAISRMRRGARIDRERELAVA